MSKRIPIALLISLTCLTSLISFTPSVQADQTDSWCHEYGRGPLSSGLVCTEVTWRRQSDSSGLVVSQVRAFIRNPSAFESDPAVDGSLIRIYNNRTGNVIWSTGFCSVYEPDNQHVYEFGTNNLHFPAEDVSLDYHFKARLTSWPDAEGQVINFSFGPGI